MLSRTSRTLGAAMAVLTAVTLAACSSSSKSGSSSGSGSGGSGGGKKYVIGVSNTLVGNGWREEMICAVKAQSLASGSVSKVISANRNGGPTEQIADLRSLISQGVNAIVVNPSDPEKLNDVISEAKKKGIVVVAVDSSVTSPDAYVVTNDQVAYGKLGAEALFKQLGGKGNVVEMRGIPGVQADTDRHTGFTEALKENPGIKVVATVNTGWDFSKAGQQALDLLNSSTKVDGIWTSGTDYTVVNAFKTLNKPPVPVIGADENGFIGQLLNSSKQIDGIWTTGVDYTVVNAFKTLKKKPVPVIGADNNAFIGQLLNESDVSGAVVTNPAVIGGVGVSVALQALQGKNPEHRITLTPAVWAKTDTKDLKSNYFPTRQPTYSARIQIPPYTTYTQDQLFGCKGPGA